MLDAMYPPRLAVELRQRGHDVIAAIERDDLRKEDDEHIFRWAAQDRRAVMTEDVRHFRPIADRYGAEERPHHGLLCVSARSFPRAQKSFGLLLGTIEAYLLAHPADDALLDTIDWLTPASDPSARLTAP